MTRARLEQHITEQYGAQPEHPWEKYPDYTVFRHAGNKKWFALRMQLSPERLGLPKGKPIDVMNVRCGPLLLGSLLKQPGFYPAYHMSRASWVTAALDGSVDGETLRWLVEESFDATKGKKG